ncbi:MAG: hypothetical protein MUC38_01180 [Cyclobacteriaceae bacterium]|jgi:hypothetical protein|nr:hypothetical protein [Cyclobacteriaceae bacterium]
MNTSPTTSVFEVNRPLAFALLCAISFLLLFIKKNFIEYETAAFEFLQDRPEGTVLRLLSALQFVSIPLVYAWKFTVIGFVLWMGCFLFGFRISFAQCWGIVLLAEFVFVIPEIIRIAWFLWVETDPALSDIGRFYPLSLMHFFDYYAIDPRFAYPLRSVNLFEIGYVFTLVQGVHFFARRDKQHAWWIVSCSYVLVFVLWLVFYMVVYK